MRAYTREQTKMQTVSKQETEVINNLVNKDLDLVNGIHRLHRGDPLPTDGKPYQYIEAPGEAPKPQNRIKEKTETPHASLNVSQSAGQTEAGEHKIVSTSWPPSAPTGHGGPREIHTHDANTAIALMKRPDAGPTGGIGLLNPPHPEAPIAHGQLREQHSGETARHELIQRRQKSIQDRKVLHGLENVNKETGLPHFTAQGGGQLPKALYQIHVEHNPRLLKIIILEILQMIL